LKNGDEHICVWQLNIILYFLLDFYRPKQLLKIFTFTNHWAFQIG